MADVLKIDRIRLKARALLSSPSPSYPLPELNLTVYTTSNSSGGIHFQWLVPLEGIQSKLRWAFSFHVYFFGCTFFVLAVYTFSSVLNIRSQISRKRFMSGINTFLCIFGVSRAISLCVDPYGSIKILPVPITNAVWAIGFPSLTSSFCLLQLAFLHLTKLKFGAKLLRIEILLRSIITLHIFSSVLRAVISSLHWSTNIVVINYICELVFLSWALFLHSSFLYIGYKVFELLDRVPATMLQPDGCQNKGIMQLVMLAPASNLATSVTAALMPTLLGPAASMSTNKTFLPAEPAFPAAANEKNERTTKAGSPSSSATNRLGQLKGKQKTFDEVKPPDDSTEITKGVVQPAKTKKLTWQSSIANENQTQTALSSSKVSTSATSNATSSNTKRPILKDASKLTIGNKMETNNQAGESKGLQPLESNEVTKTVTGCDKTSARENDILLHTILNHIAYVNRASGSSESGFAHCSHDATPTSRKKQVRFVLKITYATAILGFVLTLAEFFQKFGPYGLLQYYMKNGEVQPWPWFAFQTFCRSCEILMGSAIANITKQSVANVHRYYKHNPVIMKQRGSMFM